MSVQPNPSESFPRCFARIGYLENSQGRWKTLTCRQAIPFLKNLSIKNNNAEDQSNLSDFVVCQITTNNFSKEYAKPSTQVALEIQEILNKNSEN